MEHVFISDSIQLKVLEDLMDDQFEVLLTQICPTCLPRGITSIVIGTLYDPPSATDMPMLDYLHNCLLVIEACYHGCRIILLGDFNDSLFKKSSCLLIA